MRVAIVTVSDTVAAGTKEDASGPAALAHCRGLGWEVITSLVFSDDPSQLREQLRKLADSGRFDLILTSGGTGLGPRDNTPESTIAIADMRIPGIAEEMRRIGAQATPTALLSRAVAVVRNKTIIVNLPGSPKGAVESLAAIAHLLPHAIHVIHGGRHD
ncbi:MAG TPA: MogA/MoaB family molybdenum cofactor biosynthesis protein [Candidatus Eremiobacteraceae bacterium]|nr:MogA/MoaB family molybdenum cofactor biosynthesis protein [Candidatus Eremiobacteraceae bacterium]